MNWMLVVVLTISGFMDASGTLQIEGFSSKEECEAMAMEIDANWHNGIAKFACVLDVRSGGDV